MPMVKDYLKNNFKHGIEAGILQYGVAQETTSADVAEVLATSNMIGCLLMVSMDLIRFRRFWKLQERLRRMI